jgi:predicted amidohydrolase
MKIAIYQGQGREKRVAENLEILRSAALSAAKQGARLIIFPEMFLTGYNIVDAGFELAEPPDGPGAQKAAAIAQEANIALLYGYPEKCDTGVYNSAILMDRHANVLANYRKTHLFGPEENRLFQAGKSLVLTRLEGLTIGILICYDVEFPEAVRALTNAGARLIAVPTALMKPYCRIAETVVPARPYESQVFIAYVNRIGTESNMTYCGLSSVTGPDGHTLLRKGPGEEGVFFADVKISAIKTVRKENPVLTDRRPELYTAPVKGG